MLARNIRGFGHASARALHILAALLNRARARLRRLERRLHAGDQPLGRSRQQILDHLVAASAGHGL